MHRLLPLLLLLAAVTASAQTQDTIRVCTWNTLNFSWTVDSTRAAAVQSVLRKIQPDILVVQEIENHGGLDTLVSQFKQAIAPRDFFWIDSFGPDTWNSILYDVQKVSILYESEPIHTELRDINEWVLLVKSSGDTIHVFGCHLKAGNTPADSIQRSQEAALIRQRTDMLPPHRHWIVAGDLNTSSSAERAYEELTSLSKVRSGFVFDPIEKPGDWHSNATFAEIHTQSTRLREFDSGAVGGLDDRFDFVMLSRWLMQRYYLPGSYTTFGNDGRHFNDSINALPNTAVPDSIAEALHVASDHLPVYLDLVFPGKVSGVREEQGNVGPMDLSEDRKR